VVFGKYDEWFFNMWGAPNGPAIAKSGKAKVGMGFPNPEFNTFYLFGNDKKLTREEAVAAVAEGKPSGPSISPISNTPGHIFPQKPKITFSISSMLPLREGKNGYRPASVHCRIKYR
jgi:hypothetical protein